MITRQKFVAIKHLPQDNLLKVNNALMIGTPPITVARMVHGWGRMLKTPEHILAKQLAGYMKEMATTKEDEITGEVFITPINGQLDAMTELQWLASKQKERVVALLDKESREKKHSLTTTTEINQYGMLLKDVIKAEFDCGQREFKGPVAGKSKTTFSVTPDDKGGVNVEVTTAIEEATAIMKRAPILIEAQRVG